MESIMREVFWECGKEKEFSSKIFSKKRKFRRFPCKLPLFWFKLVNSTCSWKKFVYSNFCILLYPFLFNLTAQKFCVSLSGSKQIFVHREREGREVFFNLNSSLFVFFATWTRCKFFPRIVRWFLCTLKGEMSSGID